MFKVISCNFDLSPFPDENLMFDEKENEIIMELKKNNVKNPRFFQSNTQIKWISITKNKEAQKEVEDKKNNSNIKVRKLNEFIVYQSFFHGNVYDKKYTRSRNGQITKMKQDGDLQITVKNNEFNSDIVNFESLKSEVKKYCTKKVNGDFIKSVVTENGIIETAIRFGDGKYFYASGHKDITITMGQYQNSIEQNSIFVTKANNSYEKDNFKITVRDSFENKDVVEDLLFKKMIDYKDSDFPNQTRYYTNNGIILHYDFIMISDKYQKYHARYSSAYDLPRKFQQVSSFDLKLFYVFNIIYPGLLLCFTPQQLLYKTSDSHLINKFIENDRDQDFFGCGCVSYMSPDSKRLWVKNYGIIENGRFVQKSKNLFEIMNVFTYVHGENQIMWSNRNSTYEDEDN